MPKPHADIPIRSWPRRMRLLYLAFAAVAILAFVVVIVPALKRAELESYQRVLVAAADDRTAALNRIIHDGFADATLLASFPSVAYVLGAGAGGPLPFSAELGATRHVSELLHTHAVVDGDVDVLLIDRDLQVAARSRPDPKAPDGSAVEMARRAIAAGRTYGDVALNGGSPLVMFAAPVKAAGGETVGAIVVVVDARQSIFPAVSTRVHGSIESILGTRRGSAVALFSPLKKRSGVVINADSASAAAAAIRGATKLARYQDYAGEPVFAVTRNIAQMPWGLVVKADVNAVMRNYRMRAAQFGLLIGAVLMLVGAILHGLWTREKNEKLEVARERERLRRIAHEEMRRSYELLFAITESTGDAIFAKDLTGRYIFINAAGADEIGMRPRQIVGQTDADVYPAEVARLFRETDQSVMRGGAITIEQSATIAGSERVWLVNKSPLRGADGTITGVIGISRDITEKKRNEEEARLHQERFQSLFENAQTGVLVGLPSGELKEVNPALATMLGYSRDELLRLTVWDITPEEDHAAQRAWMENFVALGNAVFKRDKRYRRKDGAVIWVHLSGTLIRKPDGAPEYYMVSVEDITERLAAEQALAASEKRFRELYETMNQGVLYLTRQGRYLECNPAAERIMGSPLPDLLRRGKQDARWRPVRADGSVLPEAEFPTTLAFATGRPVTDALIGVFNEKDNARRWLLMNVTPSLQPGEKQPSTACVTFTDVTTLHNTESALRRAEHSYAQVSARVQRIFDANIVGMVIARPDGTIVEANDYYLDTIGYTREDLQDGLVKWNEITPPEHHAADDRAIAQLKANGVAAPYEKEYVRKDGKRVWVLLADAMLPGTDEEILCWMLNITAQKELQQQFQQAQKMEAIGRLAGGVAHDFNNILTAIRGLADIAAEEIGGNAAGFADLQEIIRSSDRATALTRQLLAFSRRQMLQPRNVDLGELVEGMQRMLRRLIGEDVVVRVERPQKELFAFADPGQIEQVLLNLAVNARDAMPNGGEITISVSTATREAVREHGYAHDGHFVMLAVSDNGCGMDDETQKRIFEPFFTTKDQGKGTGLGLATVYGIARQSGGWVRVQSAVGQGSRFEVYLPQSESEKEQRAKGGRSPGTRRTGAKILLVEDEESVRNVTRRVLMRRGHTILEAANGADALHISSEQDDIDILVSDIVMPGMSGLELLERLRQGRPHTKALLMSGYSKDALPAAFSADVSATFLEKPFSPDALLEKIDRLLERV